MYFCVLFVCFLVAPKGVLERTLENAGLYAGAAEAAARELGLPCLNLWREMQEAEPGGAWSGYLSVSEANLPVNPALWVALWVAQFSFLFLCLCLCLCGPLPSFFSYLSFSS